MSEVRRKDLARPYKAPPALSPDNYPADNMAMLSLIFGLFGMIAKVRRQIATPSGREIYARLLPPCGPYVW